MQHRCGCPIRQITGEPGIVPPSSWMVLRTLRPDANHFEDLLELVLHLMPTTMQITAKWFATEPRPFRWNQRNGRECPTGKSRCLAGVQIVEHLLDRDEQSGHVGKHRVPQAACHSRKNLTNSLSVY